MANSNYSPLYNNNTIQKLCSKTVISRTQKKAANQWLKLIDEGKLQKETENYFKFAEYILKDILDYSIKDDLNHEKGNVEFSFKDVNGNYAICFEVKGMETIDLFAPQHREKKEHQTPIKQTWDYVGSLNSNFGVATNYKDFILIERKFGYRKCHFFDFTSIRNNDEKLKEFISIFSKNNVTEGKFHDQLYNESLLVEKEITKKFYNLFNKSRILMIQEFQKNSEIDLEKAIHYAQLFLNRLTFVLVAEDTDKVPKRILSKRILQILDTTPINEHTNYVYNTIIALFDSLNEGSEEPEHIFGFNGGLFKEKILSSIFFKDYIKNSQTKNDEKLHLEFDEKSNKIIAKHKEKLNSIILYILEMSRYDFSSELNVNIMGHILEQSLSDLEIIRGYKVTKRKKEGVFYTPDFVTDYICRNTIIPYLSKSGTNDVHDLIDEYIDEIQVLQDKFEKIKIIDPACGSGAFLLKAVEVLLEIQREILQIKQAQGKFSVFRNGKEIDPKTEQLTLSKWHEETESRKIIRNNIFGIDINSESIGITKLSIFLKIVTGHEKLLTLTNNIQSGNSIINDPSTSKNALDIESVFKASVEGGKFDIIIGNPPYIPTELMEKSEKDYFSKNYDGIFRKYDSSVIFVERCLNMLKDGGYLGFIMPLTWQTGDNYPKFRKMIFDKINARVTNLVNLPFDVFPDAYVDTGITIFKKDKDVKKYQAYDYPKNEKINAIDFKRAEIINHSLILDHPEHKVFPTKITYNQTQSSHDFDELGTITNSTQGIVTSKYPINSTKKSTKWLPFLLEGDGNRYRLQIRKTEFIDSETISKILPLYTQPKIMIRRIINRQNRLMAFYENSGIITNKDYNPFIITSKDYNVFYILGLLNSRLFSYYYIKKSSLALKDDFRQTTLSEIRKFQIKHASAPIQNNIGMKAKKIGELNMIYFETKDQVLRRISENFEIKVNKKLSNFLELDFPTFRKTIESLAKKKLNLDEQNQWEKFFTDSTKKLNQIRDEIINLDNELDNDVYELYDISKDEIHLAEEKVLEPRY
jgi:hypothetical protein